MPAPANDNFANAIALTGAAGSITPVILDNATVQGGEPQSTAYAGLGPLQTAWYTWTAPANLDVVFVPSYADASVTAAWTGSSLGALVEVASVDTSTSTTGVMEFAAVAGTVYRIQVGTFGFEASSLAFGLSWTSTVSPARIGVSPGGSVFSSGGTGETVRIDGIDGVAVQRISVKRGRPDEKEKTGAGTATISGRDASGAIDPTNGLATLLIDPTAPAVISLRHPISGIRKNIFSGYTADLDYSVDVSALYADFDLSLVDALDILADAEVIPDVAGNTVPTESTGDVYYDAQNVDERIKAALADAALAAGVTEWPADKMQIFTGNVSVQGTVYSPRTSILQVIQDAADAEFPGVANFYASKDGVVTFHGRFARFHPDDVDYNIQTWDVGDIPAFGLDNTIAVIAKVSFTRGVTNLINAALATPTGIDDADIAGQFSSDSFSITTHGARSISFESLITQEGLGVGTPDALVETKKFADYYVDNFASPANRVSQIVFNAAAGAAWESANWDLILDVEISDIVHLKTTHPGGGGFDEDFFVEGISYDIDADGGAGFTNVTLTLDVSPRAYYDTNPFEE